TRGVQIADLLLDGIAVRSTGRSLLQNFPLDSEIALIEFRKALPRRPVGGNLRILDPIAAGKLVEVHARVDALVDVVDAEPRAGFGSGRSLRECCSSGQQEDQEEVKSAHRKRSP